MAQMTATKAYRKYTGRQDPENKRLNAIRDQQGRAQMKWKPEKREVMLPAEPRSNVGDCRICDRPVMASPGQRIRVASKVDGSRLLSHKKCRGSGKHKIRV